MRKIQIAISYIRLTWNLTGSCGQQRRLRGWSRMVAKQFQDGGRPPFWKSIYCHISVNKLPIANRSRQLRTHYVEGIYDNYVTLKSRLTVTQGHWKRHHWVDHTRLTVSRVIGRWILSWPWNVGQRSLKVIEISAIRKLGCGFLFAFYSNCGRICSRLRDIQCQRMAWPRKPG